MAKKDEVTEGEVIDEKRKETKVTGYSFHWDGRVWLGLFLIFIGAMFIARNVFNIDAWHYFWPIIFVVFGLVLITRSFQK